MRHLLTAFLLTALVTPTAFAQYEVNPEDVASPEAIVLTTYEVLKRAPGEEFDWDRYHSLFLEDAILIPNAEQVDGELVVFSPRSFSEWADQLTGVGTSEDAGMYEVALHNEFFRYGDVAQVASSYATSLYGQEEVFARGINFFQLVARDGRWWIASIAWDEEHAAGPLPELYEGD